MIKRLRPLAAYAAGLFISAIFIDSLRFKFTGHETPRHIFTTLRDWSGIELFYPAGPWIIGAAEFGAAVLLVVLALLMRFAGRKDLEALSQAVGGLIGVSVMSGAIGFHLFTPLGVPTPTDWANGEPVAFSSALFIAACLTWLCSVLVVALRGRAALSAVKTGPKRGEA